MKEAIIRIKVEDSLLEDFEDISINYSILAKNKKDGNIYYFRYLGPADIYEECEISKEVNNDRRKYS